VEGDEATKKESTVKFQVLGKVYTILGDAEKKQLYDESGTIDGEDDESIFSSNIKDWEKYWRSLFKKISKEDINTFFKTYKNSAEERADLLKFYEKHKGDMDLILEEVFSEDVVEDEERFRKILTEAIEKAEVKSYAKFTNESKKKTNKRKANYEKEAKEAEEMRKELGIDDSQDSLRKMILARRQVETDNLIDRLAQKYGGDNGKKGKKGKGKAVEETASNQENFSDEEAEEVTSGKKKTATASRLSGGKASTAKKVKRL
jgi:DnaJ family protein C protein 9